MKLAKSLLLGSAAALATVAGAQAADLPVRKAAPVAVEYVRVCSTYGAGFFVIPGTESCVKLTGRARAEVLLQERFSRAQDLIGLRARLRIGMDVRTPTPYGLLRTFVRVQGDSNSGTPYLGGLRGTVARDLDAVGQDQGTLFGRNVNSVAVQAAYVQFGGLTAGFAPSFFANADLPTRHFGTLRFDDVPDINTFAYTHSFGNGFSATVGIEDPYVRRISGGGFGAIEFGAGNFRGAPVPLGNRFDTIVQGGQEAPNFVGNVKFAGTWGSLQLSGAVQQLTDIGRQSDPLVTALVTREAADDEIGFAVSGSGHINLPMIAAGDAVWFNATYADGAVNYLTGGNLGTLGFATGNRPGLRVGNLAQGEGLPANLPTPDGLVRIETNEIETSQAFSIAAGLRHFWVPGLESNVFGSWSFYDAPDFAEFRRADGTVFGVVDFTEWRVGTNLIWSPVAGLDLGVEVMYTRVEAENGALRVGRGGTGAELATFRVQDDVDNFEGRIRVQRDF